MSKKFLIAMCLLTTFNVILFLAGNSTQVLQALTDVIEADVFFAGKNDDKNVVGSTISEKHISVRKGNGKMAVFTPEHISVRDEKGNEIILSPTTIMFLRIGADGKRETLRVISTDSNDEGLFINNSEVKPKKSDPSSIIVEVLNCEVGIVNNRNVRYVAADVKRSDGKKIHVEFSNPPTTGMFKLYDKIRISKKGNKWEFIEHIP